MQPSHDITGRRLTIRQADPNGYEAELTSVVQRVAKKPAQVDGLNARMLARLRQLADEGHLRSPDHWNTEGRLPDGSHFYAVKLKKIRAYGWYSNKDKGVFYISHYAYKDRDDLDPADTARVLVAWRRIERGD